MIRPQHRPQGLLSRWGLPTGIGRAAGVILLLSLLVGLAVGESFRLAMEADHRTSFEDKAGRKATALLEQTARGWAMGAVIISGETNPSLLVAATRPDPPRQEGDDNSEAARHLERLAHRIGGDGAFVVNRAGLIVASWDAQGRTRLGHDLGFRPYVQNGLRGSDSVYAAVGSSTGDRSLYIAAPIRTTQDEPIAAGVVVGRIAMSLIDQSLRDWPGIALLLSPQGVVFASTRREWLLSVSGEVTPDRIRAIAASRQFGGAFDGPHRVRSLPFDPDADTVEINGTRFMSARLPLQWNDPGGDWSLVLLADPAAATPLAARLGIAAAAGVGTCALGLLVLAARGAATVRHQAALDGESAARQQAERSDRQARQADLIAHLLHVKTAAALAQTLFAGLARDLPLHQGRLYVTEDDGQHLTLAGSLGDSTVPERIGADDGLIWDCANTGQALCIEDFPAGAGQVPSDPGEVSLRVLRPLIRDDRVLGVLDVTSPSPTAHLDHRADLDALLPVLALQIELIRTRTLASDSLAEVRRQTESVRRQQDISQQTEDWFRTILDGMPVGLLVVDRSGRIILSNREIERLSGYSLDELLGAEIERLLPPAIRDSHVGWRNALTMGEDQVVRMGSERPALPLLTRDGTERRVEITLTQTPALGSQPPCVCAMIRPV
ncbi:PAS domain S-box protein [Magnetospirillum fulvum]|uniref:PAS domain S-box protein n=1 Tax=Magnetospirillum fulvum TaxID=1082 RepID=UPI000942A80D|nr:PAS domain S-box protein [Magnetospirillum fulvum]